MRNLALTPLTNLADQRARNEVCAVAPGLYQTNWRGAEDAERLKGRGITHVLSMLDPSENPHPEQFTYLNLVPPFPTPVPFICAATLSREDRRAVRVCLWMGGWVGFVGLATLE